jgi:glycosyltransferase involved in cell wall biosynthesis
MPRQKHIVFTIVGRNYLAQAIVLHESLARTNPNILFYTVVCDTVRSEIDAVLSRGRASIPNSFKDSIVCMDELEHPSVFEMADRYEPTEFSTSVKPSAFLLLARRYPSELISYLDPDIEAFGPFMELEDFMSKHSLTVIPHFSIPPEDGLGLNALDIQRTGSFNFGYVGANTAHPTTLDTLLWWQRRLEKECRIAVDEATFVDQKWGNLFGTRPDTGVFLHPGYNTAYWNLHERTISRKENQWYANGEPLRFFHYSGYDPRNPTELSKYQDRHVLRALRPVKNLCDAYAQKLKTSGYFEYQKLGFGIAPKVDQSSRMTLRKMYDLFKDFERRQLGQAKARVNFHFYTRKVPRRLRHALIIGAWLSYQSEIVWRVIKHVGVLWQNFYEKFVLRRVAYNLPMEPNSAPALALASDQESSHESGAPTKHHPIAIVGYLSGEMGVGEAGRGLVRSFDRAQVESDLYDLTAHYARTEDREFASRLIQTPKTSAKYELAIGCFNADQLTPILRSHFAEVFLRSKRRVGYWFWETSHFPQWWAHRANYLDEVWVATEFIARAIRQKTQTPVRVIPPALPAINAIGSSRTQFGLPEEKTIFLTVFDGKSFAERKNPKGVIQAFRKALEMNPQYRDRAMLVMKTTNLTASYERELEILADGLPFRLVNRYFSRQESLGLIQCSDCLVSLHRAEGLGLSLIEAMALGKPTIATAYSGNMDFTREDTSLLVPYRMVPAIGDIGPYHGSSWADPDVKVASDKMTLVLEKNPLVAQIAAKGNAFVLEHFGVEACAQRIQRAMDEMGINRGNEIELSHSQPQVLLHAHLD